jgi:DNA helicase-2/ATP-dependent DNA helicase PcrA
MFRLFGPPGTGKTTQLLNMVDKALSSGVSPHEIAFLAFTRKAASEAKERAAVRFNLDPEDDLFYFRTIHSLTYKLLNLRQKDLMRGPQFKELGEFIGFELNKIKNVEVEDGKSGITEHPILSVINLARLKKTELRQEYNSSSIENSWEEVLYVSECYQNYKKTNRLVDYTDMLGLFVENHARICPQFKLIFLDEAQDLSPLQWDIGHSLDKHAEKMYVAGDDDQAIYRWAGADVEHFINLPGGSEVLEQSFRVPRSVHKLAETVAGRIHRRFPKVYRPRDAEGSVQRRAEVKEIDMTEGSWLVMAQANYMLTELAGELKSMGHLFERNGARSISTALSTAVNSWERVRNGDLILRASASAIYKFMSGNGHMIARGKKKIGGKEDDLLSFKMLVEEHGLLASQEMPWFEALDKIPNNDRIYITALLRRGEKFNAVPRIKLSTIHGTKGGEADNVVLMTDLTRAAMDSPGDDLHRVFYVGITRTKQNLFIIEPQDFSRAYEL